MINLIVIKVLAEPAVWGSALELAKTACQTLNLLPKMTKQSPPTMNLTNRSHRKAKLIPPRRRKKQYHLRALARKGAAASRS